MSKNRRRSAQDIHFTLEPSCISGNDVLTVEQLDQELSRHDQLLFADISFEIKRGEHVAIIGNNGTGKTTIAENLQPSDLTREDGSF